MESFFSHTDDVTLDLDALERKLVDPALKSQVRDLKSSYLKRAILDDVVKKLEYLETVVDPSMELDVRELRRHYVTDVVSDNFLEELPIWTSEMHPILACTVMESDDDTSKDAYCDFLVSLEKFKRATHRCMYYYGKFCAQKRGIVYFEIERVTFGCYSVAIRQGEITKTFEIPRLDERNDHHVFSLMKTLEMCSEIEDLVLRTRIDEIEIRGLYSGLLKAQRRIRDSKKFDTTIVFGWKEGWKEDGGPDEGSERDR